jgi:hypothetical protein
MATYLQESVLDKLATELYDSNLTLGTRSATDWLIRKLKTVQIERNKLMT